MIKNGKPTVNGWLFIVFLVLVFTTPFNPVVANPYLPIPWYILMWIGGIWLLARVTREEPGQ